MGGDEGKAGEQSEGRKDESERREPGHGQDDFDPNDIADDDPKKVQKLTAAGRDVDFHTAEE